MCVCVCACAEQDADLLREDSVKAVASRAEEVMRKEPNVLQLKATPSSPLVVSVKTCVAAISERLTL